MLRHVSEAFAEDPVRILRVARFAARFGFAVAPRDDGADARAWCESGEADYLVPERVWQEFSQGPGGAAAREHVRGARSERPRAEAAAGAARAHRAFAGELVPVRFARLAWPLKETGGGGALRAAEGAERGARARAARLPQPCRAARRARSPTPAALLELLKRADAFRRPERFAQLLEVARRRRARSSTPRALSARSSAAAGVDAGAIAARAPSPADIARLIDEARAARRSRAAT